jgi:predicted solute-binding protein
MHKQYGWSFNSLPDGLHLCITENNVPNSESIDTFVNKFTTDLRNTLTYAEKHQDEAKESSSYRLYCSTRGIPDYASDIAEEVGRMYIDVQNMTSKPNPEPVI